MDNYLIFGHILKCNFAIINFIKTKGKVVEADKLHKDTFVGANKEFKTIPWQKVQRMRHNKEKSEEDIERIQKKLIGKDDAKRIKLASMGITYEFPGYAASNASVVV